MVLNTTKETVCVNQIIGQKLDNLVVEGDMIVPDIKPDILNTVSNSGNVCIYKKEVLDGKIRIDGSVNVYITYLADNEEGDIRSLNTTLDFTNIIDFNGCKTGMTLDENISVKSIECNVINGRKIGIKAILDTNIKVYSNEDIEVVNEILDMPNLQLLEDLLEINSLVGEGSTKVYAKDTVIIDGIDDLAEILKVNVKIVNRENKVSYNKILAKAEAEVKIMYLTEDNRINLVTSRIPVMGFVDMENVVDTHICNTKYKLKNLIVKPNNVEEHSIYVEAEIEISCFVYENKNLRIIQDLYCPNMPINFTQKSIETRAYKDSIRDVLVLKERFNIEENSKIYDTELNVNIISTKIQNGTIYYEGELELDYIYGGANFNQLKTKNIKFPFNHSVTLPASDRTIVETNAEIQDASVVVLPDNTVELNVNIEFCIETYRDEKLNIIEEIDIADEPILSNHSMVIYYTKKGDTLWNIAKRFNTTIEEIANINNIENPDRIDVGMQLFIPRYVDRKCTM